MLWLKSSSTVWGQNQPHQILPKMTVTKDNEEQEKQHNPKNEIQFPYPDNRTENIELECWNVKPECTLAVDGKKRQARKDDGL